MPHVLTLSIRMLSYSFTSALRVLSSWPDTYLAPAVHNGVAHVSLDQTTDVCQPRGNSEVRVPGTASRFLKLSVTAADPQSDHYRRAFHLASGRTGRGVLGSQLHSFCGHCADRWNKLPVRWPRNPVDGVKHH